jgi:ribosomal peptide maturation radical SAM protein 1
MFGRDLPSLEAGGDVLLVVPPFAGLDRPSLAAHTLQACAEQAGFQTRVFYASMVLAEAMGDTLYEAVCFAPTSALLGERFFARSAYGVPPLGRDDPVIEAAITDLSGKVDLSPEFIRALEGRIGGWVEEVAAAIVALGFPIVGFSTTFEQTSASVALLNRVKALAPSIIALLGGANCEGEMAEGILSLPVQVDYVFSGESEEVFPAFLRDIRAGRRPSTRIIQGTQCRNLDSVPLPDFREFFDQRDAFLPESPYASADAVWLPYEASRGCWWGEKHHCTFCGINGQGMAFRERSADRVIGHLRTLVERYSLSRICMTDNIMPHRFFQTLIPRLGQEVPDLHLFYEQKANLSLEQVAALTRAGVKLIQPGIEALSTDLLKRMDKGVTGRQNIALLRYARSVGVEMNWNLLYGFPGDGAEEYRRTLELLPYLRHLQPPTDLCRLSIDRFSPYFFASARYGIRSIRPMDSYVSVLPDGADNAKIAYHFLGDYDSGVLSDTTLLASLSAEVATWQKLWERDGDEPPTLAVVAFGEDQFMVLDSRGLDDTLPVQFIDRAQAAAVLTARPMRDDDETFQWARERSLAIEYEGWHVPLATASLDVFADFERQARARTAGPSVLPVINAIAASAGRER